MTAAAPRPAVTCPNCPTCHRPPPWAEARSPIAAEGLAAGETHLGPQHLGHGSAVTPAVLDVLEAAWADDRDLYRVLFTGRSTRVRAQVWYLSNAAAGPQLIWDYRRYRSLTAAHEDCSRLIEEEQHRHGGGRPAAVTWINRVRGAGRRRRPGASRGGPGRGGAK